jgi:hypothetical protein
LIDAKLAGQPLAAPTEEPVAVLGLLDALQESLAAIKADSQAAHLPKARYSREMLDERSDFAHAAHRGAAY